MKKLLYIISILLASCSVTPTVTLNCTSVVPSSKWTSIDQTQLKKDIQIIDDSLAAKSIVAIKDPSGIRYIITQQGTGDTLPCLEKAIGAIYEGRLLSNGKVFDASTVEVAFIPNRLIVGWQIVLLKLNKGAKATIYVPSGLAYGTFSPSTKVPPNSNMVFDLQLVDYR